MEEEEYQYENEERSILARILSVTNILGLGVIIALAVVIEILLTQKVDVQKENKVLLRELDQKDSELVSLTAANGDLFDKLSQVESDRGCSAYEKKLTATRRLLAKAKSDNYKILKTFQDQTSQLKSLSEKTKILESFMDDGTNFPQ
ncbi:MAG: hypothetical protein AB8B61_01785 [Cyclobacteriaceae bacterium]